jgi:pimeloyl-ACP methyl ester carboxylesterase
MLLLGILCLISIQSVFAQDEAIEYTECIFPVPLGEILGETMDCGIFFTPQDYNEPDGLQIEIAFAVLYSTSENPLPDPVMYLEGGPGGSALSGIDDWATFEMRETRDIILFDQRGAGYSYPRLYCADIDETDLTACREQLESEGIDLADYNTINNARDANELLLALGYTEWNLFGISYGTRLALNIMRDYPQGIRSVIIDSVYPPVVDAYVEEMVGGAGSFLLMFADCSADEACNTAFPDLENRFYALIDSLNEAPITLADETVVDGVGLMSMMFQWFYDATIIPYLPLMIDELANGGQSVLEALNDGTLPIYEGEESAADPAVLFTEELYYMTEVMDDDTYNAVYDVLYEWDMTYEGLSAILSEYFAEEDAVYLEELLADVADDQLARLYALLTYEDVSDTQGMYDAFECYEEVPFNSVEDQQALTASANLPVQYELLIALPDQIETCALWQPAVAPQSETEAVISDIPTLIMVGNYDPVTPPVWGRIAAETLSNSTYAEFIGVGHASIDAGDCPLSIALTFIDDPYAPLDLSCIDTMQIEFVTEMPDLSGE